MKKIFIVEDNKELQRAYERAFRLNGYETHTASDGKKALESLHRLKEKPAIILLDVMIPSLSGLDVLRSIKADPHLKNIPVIILTNSFNEGNADLFLALGASMYLVKIENAAKDLIGKVEQTLKSSRAS